MVLEEYKGVVSTAATVVTIIQFLSGTATCKTIFKQKSTGDISGLPFVVGSFSTTLWLIYALIIQDTPMGITNVAGVISQVTYLLVYIKYCVSLVSWKTVRKQMVVFGFLLACIICYSIAQGADESGDLAMKIGLLCCTSSVAFSLSPLASLREVFRSKSTAILPFPLILSMFFVGGLWCLYGVILANPIIIYPNFLVFVIASFQLPLFVVFPDRSKKLKDPLLLEN